MNNTNCTGLMSINNFFFFKKDVTIKMCHGINVIEMCRPLYLLGLLSSHFFWPSGGVFEEHMPFLERLLKKVATRLLVEVVVF